MAYKNKENTVAYNKAYYLKNKEKIDKQTKAYSVEHKETKAKYAREHRLQSKYGLTLEDYNVMWNEQEGRCKICKKHEQELGKVLLVDHCHTTTKIRGLLCHHCNVGLGHFCDNIELMQTAINYLKEIKEKI